MNRDADQEAALVGEHENLYSPDIRRQMLAMEVSYFAPMGAWI